MIRTGLAPIDRAASTTYPRPMPVEFGVENYLSTFDGEVRARLERLRTVTQEDISSRLALFKALSHFETI